MYSCQKFAFTSFFSFNLRSQSWFQLLTVLFYDKVQTYIQCTTVKSANIDFCTTVSTVLYSKLMHYCTSAQKYTTVQYSTLQ